MKDAFLEIHPDCEFDIQMIGVACDIYIPSQKLALRLPIPPNEDQIRSNIFLKYASK
jgi:hypothetical protein